jgi:hypothetical protein
MDIAEPEWVTARMPATSEFSNKSKVNKLVGYLDIEEGVKLWSDCATYSVEVIVGGLLTQRNLFGGLGVRSVGM